MALTDNDTQLVDPGQHDPQVVLVESENLTKLHNGLHAYHERVRERESLRVAHKGHEAMHLEMFLILIFSLIAGQFILIEWRKRHYRSYRFVTFIGMWLIPIVLSIRSQFWRFVFCWLLFSCVTLLVVRKALEKPLHGATPRMVYKWFYIIHLLSCGLGIFGYAVIIAAFCGFNLVFGVLPQVWLDFGFLLIFYGSYFGVLGRDLAEMCADKMASNIGYYVPDGIPSRSLEENMCAVCGNRLLVLNNDDAVLEKTFRLPCNHVFHEFCIRGWCIVGKKETCPYCKEKVDLRGIVTNPYPFESFFFLFRS
ncbi:hypothetical protein QYM36_006726 [Artemia franciscana]|uniref:RING-type domain-containing protein n=1 Tax=Artemia franciscana TaxID=6661 RepID=A0AA88L5V0_ARTSF|nr:hypothetical protein QYM36_006726 [Artemia franciscana]